MNALKGQALELALLVTISPGAAIRADVPRPFGSAPNLAEGVKNSHGTHVNPQSLYLAQLAEGSVQRL